MRFDKSSLNGNSDKYYPFPRASLAINIGNFDFWKVGAINQLKLRVAYGRTGGQPVFGNTFTALSPSNIDGNLGATTPSSIGNPNIAPERRYSLYAEGHRWFDFRRYGRLNELPNDLPTHHVFEQMIRPFAEVQWDAKNP